MIKHLPLNTIRRDGGTQMRAEIDVLIVADYAEAYRDGSDMPPLVVFYDGSERWLADGFHRAAGAEKAGFEEIACDVRPGTRRDTVLYACGANAAHGLRRTNADKRLAVETLLHDEEWVQESDNWIAERCGVSDRMVNMVRRDLESASKISKLTQRKAADGKIYNTSNIGKSKPFAPQAGQTTFLNEPEDEPEASEEEPDDPDTGEAEIEDEPVTEDESAETEPEDNEPEPHPVETNGKAPTVSPLHTKFRDALDDFDDFTRAVAAPRHYAGYGGFPEVFARIPPEDVRTVVGMIRMLHERLGGWLTYSREIIND